MKVTIGFDPGKEGGVCFMADTGAPVLMALPFYEKELDTNKLWHLCRHVCRETLRGGDQALFVIEKVHAMPGQGVTSMFTFGSGFGELKALAKILAEPWVLVTPQEWKKHVLLGTDKSKGATVEWALRTYPSLQPDLLTKSGLAHMGKVDALAIAHWGQFYAKR